MKFGLNTFLFQSPFTNDSFHLIKKFRDWGFDSIEIAIEDVSHVNPSLLKKALDDNGITCGSVCAALGPGRDLRGSQSDQDTGLDYMKGLLDIMNIIDIAYALMAIPTMVSGFALAPKVMKEAKSYFGRLK